MHADTDRNHPVRATDMHATSPATTLGNETARTDIRHRYPASAFRGPLFGTRDRIALAMATVMLIGPLVALPLGF